jgi:hypothetical protein
VGSLIQLGDFLSFSAPLRELIFQHSFHAKSPRQFLRRIYEAGIAVKQTLVASRPKARSWFWVSACSLT